MPKPLDAVLLTHAHLDHCGRLPLLLKGGYQGGIYATDATRDLAGLILRDSAKVQSYDIERKNRKRERAGKPLLEPLYNAERSRANDDALSRRGIRPAGPGRRGHHRALHHRRPHARLGQHRTDRAGEGQNQDRRVLRRHRPDRSGDHPGRRAVQTRGPRVHGIHLRRPRQQAVEGNARRISRHHPGRGETPGAHSRARVRRRSHAADSLSPRRTVLRRHAQAVPGLSRQPDGHRSHEDLPQPSRSV